MMARKAAPLVVERTRLIQADPAAAPILVGSPGWYSWLAGATSFAFVGEHGRFTAHKERRGDTREYWKAYRHRGGRLYRAYLGKSAELTLERLDAVAAELAGDAPARVQAPEPAAQQLLQHADPQADAEQSQLPASTQHLLATKLSIPVSHSRLVARPRLVAQLDSALRQGRKLLLVSAPAGFGKTTLLAEWLASHSSGEHAHHAKHTAGMFKTAWLSLDDNDNDLGQFLAYLIVALERVCPGVSDDAWPLLRTQAAQPPVQAILTCLVNALAEPADPIVPIVLILDDYHTISLQAIHEAVAFLLDHMPAHMQIAMTTRADPPLPLARLRARVALAEVRAADLRFTHEETADLFERAHHIQLPPDTLTSLEARTEGWAAGLQLAGLSLQHQDAAHIPAFLADFTGSHTYVFDYLADEVFRRLGSTVQLFLMQSAILARLCGPLCAAVTGQHDAQTVLEQLDKANLFLVTLDSHRHWYRYHQLFRDFLYNCLHRAVGSAGIAELHRRASAWFEHNGLAGEAVEHALNARAWNDAARCLAPLMADQRFYEYFLDWPRWSDAFPDKALQADLALCMRLARILILTGHIELAERPLRLAEAIWQAANDQTRLAEVYSHRALALALKREFPQAIALAQRALADLPADALEQRGICWYVVGHSALQLGQVGFAASVLGPAYRELQGSNNILAILALAGGLARAAQLQGHLQRAAALYQDVVRRAGGVTYQEQPAVYFYIGRLHYEWNELAAAERAMHDGIAIGQRTGRGRFWPNAYAALAWVCWARGNAEQSSSFMEQALAAARSLGNPLSIAEVEARQAGLWLAQGDLAAAERWLVGRTLDMQAPVPYERQIEYLMLARIRIAQAWQAPGSAKLDMVANLLEGLIQAAQADERTADRIVLLVLLALCHAANENITRALASLGAALALAEPEGYMRTFVDEGQPMRALLLLQRAQMPAGAAGQPLRSYIERLLACFSPAVEATPAASRPSPLSEREHTILQLLADGRSVQEIAIQLIISVHTARTHVKHIYAKLEVHNRIQALERARGLQLL